MKKILIVNNNMHIGGVQRALVNLLQEMAREYEITLLLFSPRGPWMEQIPESVRVITARSPYEYLGLTREDPMSGYQRLCRGFYAGLTRVLGRKCAVDLMAPFQETLEGYDAAVSYLHSGADRSFYGGCSEFVLRHVQAKKKITWLHCDFGKIGAATSKNRKIYEGFDEIAACSEGCREAFLRCWPEFVQRVTVVENFFQPQEVLAGAEREPMRLEEGKFHIVTVARLDPEKGIDRGIRAMKQLDERVQYHIIGGGVQESALRRLVREQEVEDRVRIYGFRENPWGMVRAADLLLIPSVSEAAPMVIKEAAALGTPVLSTRTSSAEALVAGSGFGWVCDNSVEGIAQAIRSLLADPALLEEKKRQLIQCRLDNSRAKQQFRRLMQ